MLLVVLVDLVVLDILLVLHKFLDPLVILVIPDLLVVLVVLVVPQVQLLLEDL